jgi:hypothetical protein
MDRCGGVTMRNVHFLENSANALPAGRGIPIAFDGIVSRDFCEHLLDLVKRRTVQTDLIFYGAVPYKTKPGERL